jgi:hypothetical protein
MVTIKPAAPSLTRRLAAILGSKPTGKNSVVTDANVLIASDATASQALALAVVPAVAGVLSAPPAGRLLLTVSIMLDPLRRQRRQII